jgi:transposase-like protein
MGNIAMKLDCPSCRESLEVRPSGATNSEGCHLNLGTYRCPACDKELVLFATKVDQKTVDFRLVDPSLPWTFEEIMNREG